MRICRYLRHRYSCAHILIIVLVVACRAERGSQATGSIATSRLPDSLVVTSPRGLEVWFTVGRRSKAADGSACTERSLEIRRGATRTTVPLLYTGAGPILVNETTMRAELWTHCKPVSAYLVNLLSGQPVRERSSTR
jgi:hypothetical protein